MRKEFLKLAGVKTEKQFYAKFPDEASFFKAFPQAKKMIKKAQGGITQAMSSYLQSMQNLPNMQNVIQGQMQSPGVNAGMFPGNNTPDYNQMYMNMSLEDEQLKNPTDWNKIGEQVGKFAPMAGELIGGYQNLRAGRRAKKEAQKWAKVTDVQARAAESQDVDDYRQYAENARRRRNAFMPEMTGEEFFPVYGVGTNVLAKNGAEITNTYAPGTLYDNLGYEPLNDSNQVKAYRKGGYIKAQNGFANWSNTIGGGGSGFSGQDAAGATPWGAIGGLGSSLAGNMTGNDGGGQIGGAIGGAAGAMFGPAGMAIGKTIGTLAGGLLDTNDRDQRKAEAKIKNNINRMMSAQFANNIHQQYGAYAKDGTNVNPQIISEFGGNKLLALLSPPKDADMLRAGGHIRGSYVEPSASALSTMEEGGELNTHWGGYAEPMSYNPYLPDSGETVMFRGNSHEESDGKGNTGIGITFGDNPVEVERGEPATKLKDGGTGEDNLVVYGNLQIPKYGIEMLGDPKAKGKKFKNYIADLSKVEQKQNKIVEKSTNELNELNIKDPFDKLKLSSLEANINGANMKLKSIADKKIKAADLQSAINDTAEEYGLIADDLAKGKVKVDRKAIKLREAMFGTSIPKADDGKELPKLKEEDYAYVKGLYEKANKTKNKADVLKFQQEFHRLAPEYAKKVIGSEPVTTLGKQKGLSNKDLSSNEDGLFGKRTIQYMSELDNSMKKRERSADVVAPAVTKKETEKATEDDDAVFDVTSQKRNPWIDLAGQALNYIRPSDAEGLNANQLMGEMFALSNNQLEPVQAQPYSPQLRVPYDISLQDQLNEITADQRSAQRMMGYNPAAQANLAAQTYAAKSKVLADQFRANQAMKDQVYAGNIATLNDAELKNLAIYDQQYQRQEQAKSNTKAIAQEALNSISSKYAQNALENRTLGTYENLYNYRYDKSGRAINMNAPWQANIPTVYSPTGDVTYEAVLDANGKTIGFKPIKSNTSKVVVENATPVKNQQSTVYNLPAINPTGGAAYTSSWKSIPVSKEDYEILNEERDESTNKYKNIDANRKFETALKYYNETGNIPYTLGKSDYEEFTEENRKKYDSMGWVRRNGGNIKKAMNGSIVKMFKM